MMTRRHPATGARIGRRRNPGSLVSKAAADDLEGIYVGGGTRAAGRGGSCDAVRLALVRSFAGNALGKLPHKVLVARRPVNLDKSIGRK
jgi:hypothetical protein